MKKQQRVSFDPFLCGITAAVCLFFLLNGTAAASETGTEKAPVSMDKVIVSVTKSASTVDKVGGNSVTVITEADIEASRATRVDEILETVPGITVNSSGGPGTGTSVFMRGSDSKNTLVMIDGIVINDPSSANRSADIGDLNLDNVARIEVIRGAMSVMYGSNATAGVINIITRKGEGRPTVSLTAETGSYGTYKAAGTASGAAKMFNYSLSASRTDMEGFSIADKDNPDIPHDGNTDEEDGYENTTFSGRVGADISDSFNISAVMRYIDAEVELDDYADGYTGDNIETTYASDFTAVVTPNPDGPTDKRTESEQLFGKVTVRNTFASGFFNSNLSYSHSDQDRINFENDGSEGYDYEGGMDEYAWHGNLNFDTHTLSAGVGHMTESMESDSSDITEKEADTASFWVQEQLFIGENAEVIAGIRYDDHEEFGGKATFRLAPSYTLEPVDTTLKASFGTGFRSPSLFELYSAYGNPDLEPEESIGWDAGFEKDFQNGAVTIGITYFEMEYKDRIDYDFATYMYNQLEGTTETSGVESFAEWSPTETLSYRIDYTYTETDDPDGERLVRRPYHEVNINARCRFLQKGLVNMTASWVGDRKASDYAYDEDGNPVDVLDAYFLVNLAASYEITPRVEVYARIDNLLDEYYEEAFSYATAGLSGYIGVKLTY